jgi:hypothetical protein
LNSLKKVSPLALTRALFPNDVRNTRDIGATVSGDRDRRLLKQFRSGAASIEAHGGKISGAAT